ncbi:MAG: hypothetical protein ABIR54_12565 [Burkholderiaceae bacterium]|jgi:hypothetical protein
MKPFLPLLLLAFAAPLFAQSAAPASGVEWGTPMGAPAASTSSAPASAPTTILLPRPTPSAFAAARASTQATGDYFHDFAELIVRVRSVKWIEEICDETFPASAEANRHAYEVWLVDHGSFVDEVEGQFLVIDKYWGEASEQAKKEGLTVDLLKAKVDANRAGLRQDFHARGLRSFQARCEAYPEILLSPQLSLENSQAELVRSVRMGPR